MSFIGKHLVLDVITNDKSLFSNETNIATYLHKITDITGMTLIVAPQTFRFPFSNEYKRFVEKLIKEGTISPSIQEAIDKLKYRENEDSGITGFCVFSESHCSLHSWVEKDYCAIDIFSCKDFETDPVLQFTQDYFKTKYIKVIELKRYTDRFQEIKQMEI